MISPDRIRYEDRTHTYWIDGVRVPSITQALKCATYDEFDHVDAEVLRRKAEQGTGLAKMIEDHEAGTFDIEAYDPMLLPDYDAFVEWKWRSKVEILSCEKIVASKLFGYAGRLDLFVRFPDGQKAMIDTKRTAAPPASGGPQTAAQWEAYKETMGLPKEQKAERYLLHIKDGRARLVHQKDPEDLKVFLASLTVTRWREKHGKDIR